MAKYRVVNTRFWDDTYVADLSPHEKLTFLYLFTNALTTIGGIYELSLKRAAFDVGLSAKELKKAFEKLEADGKIVRKDSWIGIVNFVRHQSLNPKVRRGIEIEHEKAPTDLVSDSTFRRGTTRYPPIGYPILIETVILISRTRFPQSFPQKMTCEED